ncbi:4'-phosphopantetheinyl transferase superfamily protein [Mycoplasma phocoeninasale]|uniref:4'-phosphopantetheinyl transferase superfamily protein n=2 Tax=Mycoplasma phocoeninasale TaxID=2726117 RepID=A0A858U519_9MOLU|nr:4'-phosphopantetheinyl transferase superfamily protein [Mycoplasma phocoeninasale]MBN0970946.1 4'-phosphopantetheinyl transferase superfamily protein [Mycoplasma phocoeninasale]QJG66517.1 4'-phosphopantetheinyl transferase superfamily protein [Mycoplasma phocoeninasale]
MIGIDLVKISRFKKIKKHHVAKFLHPCEINEWEKLPKKRQIRYLANRWAIKEAIYKADNKYWDFTKILINKNKSGKYQFENFEITTTNESNHVIAMTFKLGGINEIKN